MEMGIALACAGALALLASVAVIPAVIRISHWRKWYDVPNDRKIHTGPIPRLGGIGMFVAFLVGAAAVPLLLPVARPAAWPVSYDWRYAPVFAAFCIIHALGLVDDFRPLRALFKFLLQIAAAALVTVGGFGITSFWIPGFGEHSLGVFAWPATVLWIVGISNAINLVDGIDGLAGGITGFTALTLGIVSLLQGQAVPALFAFALLGAVLGFLFFNFPPARIFMGDSGSLLLGFILAVIPLLGAPEWTSTVGLLPVATALTIPIIDTATAIARRLREKRAIHAPDKEHIHHKLLSLGLRDTSILFLVYALSALFAAAAVVSVILDRVSGRVSGFVLLAAVWLCSCAGYSILHRAAKRLKGSLARD
jgi:UDP-GlcNAc:undecaprenyl-phosphate GlcNAc-1-phosphate transferase